MFLYWCCTYGRLYNFTRSFSSKEKTPPVSEKKKSESSSGVKITPYDHPEIQRKSLQVIVPQQKSRNALMMMEASYPLLKL